MSLLWLWVALGLYSVGLVHAMATVILRRPAWFRTGLAAIGVGALFHFVSLMERGFAVARFPATNIAEASSLFAFLITLGFLLIHWRYHVASLSVFTFPIVFVMTLASGLNQQEITEVPTVLKASWVPLHVSLALVGYTALFLACFAGVMYLIQERELKRRTPHAFYYRLPPLETIDRFGSAALTAGFPCITLGLVIGAVGAAGEWGATWMLDPKAILSFVLWLIYGLLILSRVGLGWRGHKAALFSIVGMAMALVSWSANYMSSQHTFLGH